MTFDEITADNLDHILKQDGHQFVGRNYDYEYWDFMYEASPGMQVDLLGYGVVEVVDAIIGKDNAVYRGEDTYDNYIILKVGDRFFKKTGYYSSWDGGGMDGPWFEVEKIEKTIYVWEKRLDY